MICFSFSTIIDKDGEIFFLNCLKLNNDLQHDNVAHKILNLKMLYLGLSKISKKNRQPSMSGTNDARETRSC